MSTSIVLQRNPRFHLFGFKWVTSKTKTTRWSTNFLFYSSRILIKRFVSSSTSTSSSLWIPLSTTEHFNDCRWKDPPTSSVRTPPLTSTSSSPFSFINTTPSIHTNSSLSTQNLSDHFYHNHVLEKYAMKQCTKLTLRQLEMVARTMTDRKLLKSANFLKEEITIRLAHRIRKFQSLPYIITSRSQFQTIYQLYWDTFTALRTFPEIKNASMNLDFCNLIQQELIQHKKTLPALTSAVFPNQTYDLNSFMKQTLCSQLGRRVLAYHHLAMTFGSLEGRSGMVCKHTHIGSLLQSCLQSFPFPCHYQIEGPNVELTTIPELLFFCFNQFFKNSFKNQCHSLPSRQPLLITICNAPNHIMIRISDSTGGMSNQTLQQLWSFTHVAKKPDELGCALSKVGLEYWGGSVHCVSMEGYGTDTYITLNKDGSFPEGLED